MSFIDNIGWMIGAGFGALLMALPWFLFIMGGFGS